MFFFSLSKGIRIVFDENLFAMQALVIDGNCRSVFNVGRLAFKFLESGIFKLGGLHILGGLLAAISVYSILLCIKKNRKITV